MVLLAVFAAADGAELLLTELDGRYWTAETCASFTGRVVGLYATEGTVTFTDYRYRESESSQPLRHGDARA